MRIELDKLEKDGGRFSRTYEIGELSFDDDELRLIETAEIRGRVGRKGQEVELRGELAGKIGAVCDRCLQPVEIPVRSRFRERFVPAVGWRAEPQHELQEEDLNLAVFDGEAIELDDLVREELLLAVPAHVLCREDCKGLCPVCGIDRNRSSCQCETGETDSRWEGLENLRF
jgi:uncharacterized protein